jgi:Cytochrome c7 and related cytochrome c
MLGPAWNGKSGSLAGQISPGPLARAHQELEGALKCTKCHAGRKEAMSANCQGCHRDIEWLVQRNEGYHGTREVRTATCASCHPDHAGADFRLVKWPDGSLERFDHRRAGWPLELSHAKTECIDCHTIKFQHSPAARLGARKNADNALTGLETACASCHEDIHRGGLGTECTKCHDAGKWTITPGFKHDTTGYALTNKHTEVKCDKCHLTPELATKRDAGGHPIPVYKPVPHKSCADCHKDPHAGRLGPNCTNCHTTSSFKLIDKQNFEHDRTRFPLKGKHATVRCAGCHKDFSTQELKKPGFQTCGACHGDAHGGTATLAGKVADCAECHGLAGFTPATFTVERHRTTKYALEGKHQTVSCASCHRKETNPTLAARLGSSKVVIRPLFGRCLDCHTDLHGGQLTGRADKGECSACHKVAGWTPSGFDAAQHAKLRLPLEGRHREIDCRDCHGADRKALPPLPKTVTLGKAGFLFKGVEVDCQACHADPHHGRFAAQGARAKTTGCLTCHNTTAFRPSTADIATHKTYGFPLEGAHRATPCLACHAEMKAAPAKRSSLIAAGTVFPALAFSAKTACADCHETPHGNQFTARKDAGKCEACHGTDAFAPASRFDHNRDAAFSLKGAHEQVPCNRCHPTDTGSADPKRLVYRPVSGKCESCHAGKETR